MMEALPFWDMDVATAGMRSNSTEQSIWTQSSIGGAPLSSAVLQHAALGRVGGLLSLSWEVVDEVVIVGTSRSFL